MIKETNRNVHVASILDSKDLTNGILLSTELKDKEGKIIATASGPITTHEKIKRCRVHIKRSLQYMRTEIILNTISS